MGNMCNDCMARVPYATLIATIMCCLGVGIFCGTMYKGATLSALMMDQVFHLRLGWLEAVQLIFATVGASMAALGFMILCVGCLATGATRHKVYRAWRSRVGGRISCAVFMTITYILQLAWLLIFAFLVITTLIFTIFWGLCSNPRVQSLDQCIDFTQFDFMFPNNTRTEDMKVCGSQEVKLFCKDYVEKAEMMFILATVASMLVVLSLIHYLMCLSANYAHIRDHEKFQELQELQYLQDPGDPDSPQPGIGTLGSHHRAKDRY
ncbi:proteolipid protein DM beta isoform X2 [Orussus abietinus]|uniref:proteolipid protein DM beta isoform X2 n=1 Tax=Orussus abietinus TaxID=222816 RepID=UPI0006259582|nr:proteolipid protein DM beta isoform X2 [Orussus abietinus]